VCLTRICDYKFAVYGFFAEHRLNCERKANKKEKNGLLGFVRTRDFLAGCVGSGKI